MPAAQRGSVVKRPTGWAARYYDEHGIRQFMPGFDTKTAARNWLDDKVDEVTALRRGITLPSTLRAGSVTELVETFLEKHGRTIDPATKRKLERQLRKFTAEFGSRDPNSLARIEMEDWHAGLPAGSQHDVFRAARQTLTWGLARQLISVNAATGIQNPKRKRHERSPIVPFETWAEVEKVADAIERLQLAKGSAAAGIYRAIPAFAVGTGLRPEEWIALERDDVDRKAGVVRVTKRYSGGELKQGGKTGGSVRDVQLRARVLRALDAMPTRIDTPLLFPAPKGGHIDLDRFRKRDWLPALEEAGLPRRGPYAMRHTFATWAIEARDPAPMVLASIMGTSLRELEDTYFRWMRRSDGQVRAALDAYDAKVVSL